MANVTYIALLRGINVGGHKLIRMEQLRKSIEALGMGNVRTYVQSGNVVFQAPKQPATALQQKLEQKIARDFGHAPSVIVRTAAEIAAVLGKNPFSRRTGIDLARLHVTFLSDAPSKTALKALLARDVKPDEFQCVGKEIYLYLPNGFAKTKLNISLFEKLLSVRATTRNWNTVNRLSEMAG